MTLNLPDPVVDIPLLRKAVEWAEVEAAKPWHSCQWNQRAWRNVYAACGTQYCIAGWVCHAAGEEWSYQTAELLLRGGRTVPERAQELLGLSGTQARELFWFENTIEDIRRIAEQIAGERL